MATRGKQPVTMKLLIPSLIALLALSIPSAADPTGTAFTYQGRLDQNGAPANGLFDLKFELYDAAADGNPVGIPVELAAQPITGGLFTTELDFSGPAVFDGTAYWMEISARTAGAPDYLAVPGRVPVRPAPYAIHALSAGAVKDGAITESSLADGSVTGNKIAPASVGLSQLTAPGVPAAGQFLAFDGAELAWVNGAGGGGSSPWLLSGTTVHYSAGQVGIGTSAPSPGYALGVNGNVQFTPGGTGGTIQFGSPNFETGMTWNNPSTRADLRFDGSTVKLVAGPTGGPPGNANGIIINTSGNVGMGVVAPVANVRLAVAGNVQFTPGGSGGTMQFGSPNFETGLTWTTASTRADLRFDGGTVKLVAGPAGGPPSNFSGVAVTTGGNVGIGKTDPATKLDIAGDVSSTRLFLRADPVAPSNAAVLSTDAGVVNFVPYNTALNRAMNVIANNVTANDVTMRDGSVRKLTIRGGADLAEPFPMSHAGVEPGTVVVIDEKNPGKLKASTRAYDKKVAGIVSGANGIEPGISMIQEDKLEAGENVALSGRVYVKANSSAGSIEPGDLITTSSTPGQAMKAAEHDKAQGAILGKAMTGLSDGEGMVLVLVTLQ